MLLTIVAYRSQAAVDLPKISHLTFLDIHLLSGLGFTSLVAVGNVAATQLGDAAARFDGLAATALGWGHALGWLALGAASWAAYVDGREAIQRHEAGERSACYTLHPTSYILHPTSYILHPTSYTLRWAGCAPI